MMDLGPNISGTVIWGVIDQWEEVVHFHSHMYSQWSNNSISTINISVLLHYLVFVLDFPEFVLTLKMITPWKTGFY